MEALALLVIGLVVYQIIAEYVGDSQRKHEERERQKGKAWK